MLAFFHHDNFLFFQPEQQDVFQFLFLKRASKNLAFMGSRDGRIQYFHSDFSVRRNAFGVKYL
jgi:hypothetical protein